MENIFSFNIIKVLFMVVFNLNRSNWDTLRIEKICVKKKSLFLNVLNKTEHDKFYKVAALKTMDSAYSIFCCRLGYLFID